MATFKNVAHSIIGIPTYTVSLLHAPRLECRLEIELFNLTINFRNCDLMCFAALLIYLQ
jgi:hypothetical protein